MYNGERVDKNQCTAYQLGDEDDELNDDGCCLKNALKLLFALYLFSKMVIRGGNKKVFDAALFSQITRIYFAHNLRHFSIDLAGAAMCTLDKPRGRLTFTISMNEMNTHTQFWSMDDERLY